MNIIVCAAVQDTYVGKQNNVLTFYFSFTDVLLVLKNKSAHYEKVCSSDTFLKIWYRRIESTGFSEQHNYNYC